MKLKKIKVFQKEYILHLVPLRGKTVCVGPYSLENVIQEQDRKGGYSQFLQSIDAQIDYVVPDYILKKSPTHIIEFLEEILNIKK